MTDQATKIALGEAVIGYVFQDKALIWEAIQAPGHLNERLALVGDAAMRLFLHKQSYGRGLSKGKSQSSISHNVLNRELTVHRPVKHPS